MKFFQSKKKITTRDFRAKSDDPAQALKDELDAAIVPTIRASGRKTPDEISETRVIKKADAGGKAEAAEAAGDTAKMAADEADKPAADAAPEKASTGEAVVENMRLFPGFEDQPFEVGYAVYSAPAYGLAAKAPMLLVRWKSGDGESDWFPLPPMFNKSLLARIHERDHDLDRLLLDYGYDADQLATSRKSDA